MNQPEIKISIVIPVYNVSQCLRICLNSVLAQTYKNWEAVCVDDGSSDDSGKILDEYAAVDSRIKIVHQENHGVSAARNRALELVSGDYVTFCDADDVMYPWALEHLASLCSQHNPCMVRFGCRWIDRYGVQPVMTSDPQCLVYDACTTTGTPVKKSCLVFIIIISSIAKSVKFEERRMGEDSLFGLECLKKSTRTLIANDVLYDYVQRTGSATHTKTLTAFKSFTDYFVRATEICRTFPNWAGFRRNHGIYLVDSLFLHCMPEVERLPRESQEEARQYLSRKFSDIFKDHDFGNCVAIRFCNFCLGGNHWIILNVAGRYPYLLMHKIRSFIVTSPVLSSLIKKMLGKGHR